MKKHTNCRVCSSDRLIPYLDLGQLPLSNNLAESPLDPIHLQRYPLQVLLCEKCGLSQLSVVIDPEVMFSHYVYRSSIAQGYIDHCWDMARDLKEKLSLTPESFMVDIAGNDGALLQQFREVIGLGILNVDPAINLAAICQGLGIPTMTRFWGMEAAKGVVLGFGKADLITATNVFAHCDNIRDFMEGVKYALKPTGVLILEFPYLIDFIEKREFDTVYFEHLSYFSIYPLTILCEDLGMEVLSVSKQDIHGGSVRVTIGYGSPDDSVMEFINAEKPYRSITPYHEFAEDVHLTIRDLAWNLNRLKASIAGFAASAKGNTLLNCAGITCGSMKYIVDETPEKIGKYSPGTFIPIVSMMDFKRNFPDYLVILSWNFATEIMRKCRDHGYQGKFIIPIPEFKIID